MTRDLFLIFVGFVLAVLMTRLWIVFTVLAFAGLGLVAWIVWRDEVRHRR